VIRLFCWFYNATPGAIVWRTLHLYECWTYIRFTAVALFIAVRHWLNATPWLKDARTPVARTAIKAVANIFQRPWFTRTWIVQEVLAAKQAVFICGTQSLSLDRMSASIEMIQYYINADRYRSPYIDCQYQRLVPFMGVLAAKRLGGGLGPLTKQRYSLLYLMAVFSDMHATDERDKVYAFLGLSSERIKPDYRRPVTEVYTATAKGLIEKSNNLDVLRACLFTGSVPGLPSWVPDWTVKELRSVGGWAYWRKPYALEALADQPVATFSSDSLTMRVQGIAVGTLQGSPTIMVGLGPNAVRYMEPYRRVLQSIFTIMRMPISLAIRLPGIRLLLSYLEVHDMWNFGYVFKYVRMAVEAPTSGPIEIPRTLEAKGAFFSNQGRPEMPIHTWMFVPKAADGQLVKGRRKWVNFASTYAGNARAGDLLVMLFGAKVPFLIRKTSDTEAEVESRENVVGRELANADDEHLGEKPSHEYTLVGPASFGGTLIDTVVWESVKRRVLDGELWPESMSLS
jgi:hypothetical protein